jgi:hypothetical protein
VSSATTHPHVAIIRRLYTDLRTIGDVAHKGIALHPGSSGLLDVGTLYGVEAVTDHMKALYRLSHGTLRIDLDAVIANDCFTTAVGTLEITAPDPKTVPFCGVWRFEDGLIVEHWEHDWNPHDLADVTERLLP